jgi:hypothetical protein
MTAALALHGVLLHGTNQRGLHFTVATEKNVQITWDYIAPCGFWEVLQRTRIRRA